MTTETLGEEIKHVPKKYWYIGGGLVLVILIYVYLRNKSLAAANQASTNMDGLAAAMQIPGGVSYSPISSGDSSGTGDNADISGELAALTSATNAATTAGTTATTGTTATSAPAVGTLTSSAPVTYSATSNMPANGYVDTTGTGIFSNTGVEASFQDLQNFFTSHPIDGNYSNQASALQAAEGLGFSETAFSQAESVWAVANSPGSATYGILHPAISNDPGLTASVPYSPVAPPAIVTPAAPVLSVSAAPGISNADIYNFYSQHSSDPAALRAAEAQYGLSDAQLQAAGVPLSALQGNSTGATGGGGIGGGNVGGGAANGGANGNGGPGDGDGGVSA